jgi:hypothetical protein
LIVHLYAQCWNDEWMLPFFFRHYDRLVDRYFIYDDGSTDDTWSILQSHPKVEARRFARTDPDSFVRSEQTFSNECWKESRGQADWVIVTDLDEHLVHPGGRDYLSSSAAAGVTLIPALGFQMISDRLPGPHEELSVTCRLGAPWDKMMKASIFDPDEIAEIKFVTGRHVSRPAGRVELPARDEMVLLHYKYLGFERTLERHRMLLAGLGDTDLERGWGFQYTWTEDELRADWDAVARDAVDWTTVGRDPDWRYPVEPWWEHYRR